MLWEKQRGWFTTAPFPEPEVFDFPEGIGPVECVNVEHEKVLLVPRWVDCRRVKAVVWQTALNPVIALELLTNGDWTGAESSARRPSRRSRSWPSSRSTARRTACSS